MTCSNQECFKEIKTIIFLTTLYIALTLFSNISSLRIISVMTLSMDAGTLLYPATFTVRDMIHKKTNSKIAYYTIWLAAIFNVIMFITFYLVSILPPDSSVGLQKEFGLVLIPTWRIIVGSIVAMVIAEFIDTKVYEKVVKKFKDKKQWLRVLISNSVSIPLDTFLMCTIAFYGTMDNKILIAIIISNILIKLLITLVSLNWIYFVKS
ncbi:MAG TPA: hypothetical protein DEP72_08670 [Clostridiales bacterium]|nr:MAG: hypothetical protein A2Y18_02195 [Clostridiales bacterium GWD2_32_19]HCC08211.1 hypothetical protein [Clostridiales bacterium]